MTAAAETREGDSRRILIAFIVATAFVMQGIDSTLLIIAIPTISEELGVDVLLLHLAVTGYLLSLALFMPVSGWFADRFGARTVFCISLVIFTAGSVFAGLAPNLEIMVAARALQGVGGALMTPLGRLIVLRTFGPGRVLDATTWMTLPMMLGPLLGPLIGATIISFTSWRWIFFVNVPICLGAIACTLIFVPHDRPEGRRPFDFQGFIIAGIALVTFQLSIEHLVIPLLGPAVHLPLFAASALMLWIYIRYARTKQNPAIDLRLFNIQSFSVGVLGGGLGRIGMNASFLLVPLLLQTGMGMDPLMAAVFTSTGAIGAFTAKPLLHFSINRAGFAWTITGLCIAGGILTAAFAPLAFAPGLAILIPLVMLLGAVRGMYFNALNTLTYADVPNGLLSQSVSAGGVFQQFAMGMGVSVSSVVLSLLAGSHDAPDLMSFAQTFLIMAAFPLLSVPFILNLRRPRNARSSERTRPAVARGSRQHGASSMDTPEPTRAEQVEHYVVPRLDTPSLPVSGTQARFPVRRIYCVGRNYAAHTVEMGHDPDREPPFFFQKNADDILPEGENFPYPPASNDVHFEVELVVALQRGGKNIAADEALDCVFGYAVGLDMTRRDLQAEAKALGRPWEVGKAFEASAPCGPITPAAQIGEVSSGAIWVDVNGERRQSGDLNQMIWNIPQIIAHLSALFTLRPGDLIFTGTPAGVGAIVAGDSLVCHIDRLPELLVAVR